MANQPVDIITLINHKVIKFNAEDTIFPQISKGGVVTLTNILETPEDVKKLKTNDTFSVLLTLECKASDGKSEKTAFTVSCSVSGSFIVAQCAQNEINPIGNNTLWNTAASQLMPLLSSYVSEQITRMGFKNIQIPPFLPVTQAEPTTVAPKVLRKGKSAKAKTKNT